MDHKLRGQTAAEGGGRETKRGQELGEVWLLPLLQLQQQKYGTFPELENE